MFIVKVKMAFLCALGRLEVLVGQARSAVMCSASVSGTDTGGLVKDRGYTYLTGSSAKTAMILIHPIGVGLDRSYWNRFLRAYETNGPQLHVYAPDLRGCGEFKVQPQKVTVEEIANDLTGFVEDTIQKPVVIYTEGALAGAGLLLANQLGPDMLKGVILGTPPPLTFLSEGVNPISTRLAWAFFSSPLGLFLFNYVRRREFLKNFTKKNLFLEEVDDEWLDTLENAASDLGSRWAVFSFLASAWREDFRPLMRNIEAPVLLLMGNDSAIITKPKMNRAAEERIADYGKEFPNMQSVVIRGSNVLAYEYAEDTVKAIVPFIDELLA